MVNVAYVFPGQGSQSLGMLSELAENNSLIIDVFAQVSECIGYDLWRLVQAGPESKLNQTEYTQVAVLAADVAIYRLLIKAGVSNPRLMSGHSLGEYAALVCANALSLADAAILVSQRGRIMQDNVPVGHGAMAAIVGLTDQEVLRLCLEASHGPYEVTPANFNAIGQVVIAGHVSAVQAAVDLAEERQARLAKILPVSVPCHCPLLLEAADIFTEYLAKTPFHPPAVEVISSIDLSSYQSPQQIRELLKQQLYCPVRWVDTIRLMKAKNIDIVLECGPGRVLTGLVKRIDNTILTLPSCTQDLLETAIFKLIDCGLQEEIA
jgi:[acyl-carrier-protein] S-malonyltransferase